MSASQAFMDEEDLEEDEDLQDEGREIKPAAKKNGADAEDTDNVGDDSVELNVEELLHLLEAECPLGQCNRGMTAKQRLEDLMEARRARQAVEDFEDYQL